MTSSLVAHAVVIEQPQQLAVRELKLTPPGPADLVVQTEWSGISTGTERLFWSGKMPPFPGMGYPLVPGYEAVGRVMAVGAGSDNWIGQRVFVPGARCFGEVRGLFGASASRLVVPGAAEDDRPLRTADVPTNLPGDVTTIALVSLALSTWLWSLVEGFFARSLALGWIGVALLLIAGVALVALLALAGEPHHDDVRRLHRDHDPLAPAGVPDGVARAEERRLRLRARGDRDGFYEQERNFREASHSPPFGRLVALVVSGYDGQAVRDIARQLGKAAPNARDVKVWGPTPAFYALLRGQTRERLLVQAAKSVDLQAYLKAWLALVKIPASVRVTVDVDPISFF